MGKPKYHRTNVAIEPSLKAAVKKIAEDLNIPFNEAVAIALKQYVDSMTF